MEESTWTEGSTFTTTFKKTKTKKHIVPCTHQQTWTLPTQTRSGRYGNAFFLFSSISVKLWSLMSSFPHQINTLIFILTKFTSFQMAKDMWEALIYLPAIALLERSNYRCCWGYLSLLLYDNYKIFLYTTEGLNKSSFCF